jgi:hypothetical protein
MIKLTWGELRDNEFMHALEGLFEKKQGYDVAMKIALLGEEIKKQRTLLNNAHEALLKEFGTPDPAKRGHYKLNDATIDKYEEEMKKLYDHSFEVKVNKFDAKKLSEKYEFSPKELIFLKPLFMSFEESAAKPNLASVKDKETHQEQPAH